MNVLVTYYSETGNTEKLAHAVYAGVTEMQDGQEIAAEILPVSQADRLARYDLILFGFPVHTHSVPPEVVPFLKNLPEAKKVAFFITHGSLRRGILAKQALEHAAILVSDVHVLGSFECQGEVKSTVIDDLMKKPEHRAWAQEALGANTHPNEHDLEDGKEFGKQMVKSARLKR